MAGQLDGKVAVITGGCSGIGLGTVEVFMAEGAQVVVGDLHGQPVLTGIHRRPLRHRPRPQHPALLQPEVEVGVATQNLRLQPVSQRLLAGWLERHRPDAILALGSSVCQQLGQLGFSVPNDVAFVDLSLEVDDRRWAGVRPNSERAGEIAVEMLIGLMQQNLCGVPDVPTTTLVEGAWVEGESLPALRLQSAC